MESSFVEEKKNGGRSGFSSIIEIWGGRCGGWVGGWGIVIERLEGRVRLRFFLLFLILGSRLWMRRL